MRRLFVLLILSCTTFAFTRVHLQHELTVSNKNNNFVFNKSREILTQVDTFLISGNLEYFHKRLKIKPVSSATITLRGNSYNITTTTDKSGKFKLRYPANDGLTNISIEIISVGFMNKTVTDIIIAEKKEIELGTIKMEKWKGPVVVF